MLAQRQHDGVLTASERTTLACVFETFAPPEADSASALRWMERKIGLLTEPRRAHLRSLLQVLGSPFLTGSMTGKPFPFSQLRFQDRERMLLRMAQSDIPKVRAAFQALKRLCLFMAYAAVDRAGNNPLWERIGYPGPRQDRPTQLDNLRVRTQPSDELFADVVVVGSGAGGGVSAAVFAAAGKRVIVLEAGPHLEYDAFTQREVEMMSALYLDAASTTSEDLAIPLLAGSCIGGGTTVNSCASISLPIEIAAQWSAAAGGIDFNGTLAPHQASVSQRLGLTVPQRHNNNNAALAAGCQRLGWHVDFLPRNADNCGDGCGYCGLGCAYGCKRSTARTYLHDAIAAGATIVANAYVERVLTNGASVSGVSAKVRDVTTGGRRVVRVHASQVVLAAGSLRTPGILTRSGQNGEHVGRHLRLHPSTGLAVGFDHEIDAWRGPMQTAYSNQFADLDELYGARLETVPMHPGQAALAVPWQGRAAHAEWLREARNFAALIALTRDRGEGHLNGRDGERVHYRLNQYDGKHMLTALNGLVDAAFAAGARRVMTLHATPLRLEREDASAQRRAAFRDAIFAAGTGPNRLGIYSAHQMGTCRMHSDPRKGVVDGHGAVHGMRGLIVTDASVFPLASGVNPMLTIMALAHRSASFHAKA